MESANRFYRSIKNIAKIAVPDQDMPDIVTGKVKSVSPLQITIENKFSLSGTQLILSPWCMTHKAHKHEVPEVGSTYDAGGWRGLATGDDVLMLRVSKGQQYVVLWRLGAL